MAADVVGLVGHAGGDAALGGSADQEGGEEADAGLVGETLGGEWMLAYGERERKSDTHKKRQTNGTEGAVHQ